MTTELLDVVPELRTEFVRRDVGAESVVWSPVAPQPVALDPIATVMLDVIDGTASVGELAIDVHKAVGVPKQDAQRQVTRVVERFGAAGLLTSSTSSTAAATADEAIRSRDIFVGGATPCSENASRLGTVTLHLRFGEQTVRVSCDSRRGARKLRAALNEHIVEPTEDPPLAFVLTAPQGLKRNHHLADRSGFVLSEGRGLDSGLHALASQLTALCPPAPGTVRIQARAVVAGDRAILCLFPLLYVPMVEEADLVRQGLRVVDRLAIDVDIESGRMANPEVPWSPLAALDAGPGHAGTGGKRTATAVVTVSGSVGSGVPSRASVVAGLAASGLHGSAADLLDAAIRLTEDAELRATPPEHTPLVELLGELAGPRA